MEAHSMYRDGNTDGALLIYTLMAELGYEVAQSNVAFILDLGKLTFPEDWTLNLHMNIVNTLTTSVH